MYTVFENHLNCSLSIFSSFSPYECISTIAVDGSAISMIQLEDREMLTLVIGARNDLVFVSLETYQVEMRTEAALGSKVLMGDTLIQKGRNCIIGGTDIIGIVDIREGIVKRKIKNLKFKKIKAMVNMNENIILIANHRKELIAYDIEIEIICLLIKNE